MDASQPAVPSTAGSLALRYGAEAAPDAGPWNEHISLLVSHRSIRGYRSDAPPAGKSFPVSCVSCATRQSASK